MISGGLRELYWGLIWVFWSVSKHFIMTRQVTVVSGASLRKVYGGLSEGLPSMPIPRCQNGHQSALT